VSETFAEQSETGTLSGMGNYAIRDRLPDSVSEWFADPEDVHGQYRVLSALGSPVHPARAFGALVEVLGTLCATDDGRLGEASSLNHVRSVVRVGGDRRVVKLSVQEQGDEIAVLSAWDDKGLAGSSVPKVSVWGRTGDGILWTMQEPLPSLSGPSANPDQVFFDALGLAERLRLPARDLPDGIEELRRRIGSLRASSVSGRVVEEVASRIQRLQGPRFAVHGNFSFANLLEGPSGLSAVGAAGLVGFAASDPARLLAEFLAEHVPENLVYVDFLLDAASARLERFELATLTAAELLCRTSAPASDADATVWLVAAAEQCLR
jgi:hypothetical protein